MIYPHSILSNLKPYIEGKKHIKRVQTFKKQLYGTINSNNVLTEFFPRQKFGF